VEKRVEVSKDILSHEIRARDRRSGVRNSVAKKLHSLAASILVLLAIAGCAKAESKPEATAASDSSALATQAEKAIVSYPQPDAQIAIPPVQKVTGELLVVWKHTSIGWAETHGYDTEVLRFSRLGSGTLGGVKVFRRDLSGETLMESYIFGRTGDGFEILSDTGEDKGNALYLLSWKDGSLIAKGKRDVRTYSRGADGSLSFTRQIGALSLVDAWKAPTGESEHFEKGIPMRRGWYEKRNGGRGVFTIREFGDPDGALDVGVEFYPGEGETRLRSGAVEPLSESLVAGADPYLTSETFLENVAFIDIFVSRVSGDANDPGLRPLLALRSMSIM
jgi:hypothetical protein